MITFNETTIYLGLLTLVFLPYIHLFFIMIIFRIYQLVEDKIKAD
jgi:hypothetical protein